MDEPCGPEIASPGFQLHLEHSTTSSPMSQKNPSECGVKLVHACIPWLWLICLQEMLEAFAILCSIFLSVATAIEARSTEGEIHFSRLEALDPQKRELLEARFSTPRVCAEFTSIQLLILYFVVINQICWAMIFI